MHCPTSLMTLWSHHRRGACAEEPKNEYRWFSMDPTDPAWFESYCLSGRAAANLRTASILYLPGSIYRWPFGRYSSATQPAWVLSFLPKNDGGCALTAHGLKTKSPKAAKTGGRILTTPQNCTCTVACMTVLGQISSHSEEHYIFWTIKWLTGQLH